MQTDTRVEVASVGQRVAAWPEKIKNYVEELQAEMRRVTWPGWPQVRATTIVVIVAVFAFAAYFAVIDFIITRLVARIFETFAK